MIVHSSRQVVRLRGTRAMKHGSTFHAFETLESRRLLASNGLSAIYFDGLNFTGRTTSRVDRNVAFDFANSRPAPGIRGNTYSVRWSGLVQANATGMFK